MTKLQEALKRHAELTMRYNQMIWNNYSRPDLTGIVRKDGGPITLVMRLDEKGWPNWYCMDKDEDLTTIPLPGKEDEYERVGLEAHKLHVQLHEAFLEVERLTKEVA